MVTEPETYKYWTPVERNAPNSAHSFALQLIGRDKHVLELGCAAGHVTRALVDQGCTVVGVEYDEKAASIAGEVAEEVLIVDLFDADNLTKALEGRDFDVVYAGDVLEHLPDPAGVLTAARRALRPGGTVVISVPNVAHVDVKLALLAGEFRYREVGLLDRTHLRFFTRESLYELLDSAGLELAELRRVMCPQFETELQIDPATIGPETLERALDDPEALTYQFVLKAVCNDGHSELALAAQRYRELDTAFGRERLARVAAERELRAANERTEQARADLAQLQQQVEQGRAAQHELESLVQTKTFRATSGLRGVYQRIRGG